MLRILRALGVNTNSLIVSDKLMTPTYTKPVFRRETGIEETNRLDHKNTRPTPGDIEEKIIDSIWEMAPQVDAIIALDQLTNEGYGVLTPKIREQLARLGNQYPDLILYADSRAFIQRFQNMIIKCNHIEAIKLFFTGKEQEPQEKPFVQEEVEKCILELSKLKNRRVFISCGSKGIMVLDENGFPVLIPAVPLSSDMQIDIVGAGDACSSGIVTSLCSGSTPKEAAFIGNLVAGITIQVIGTTGTASRKQVLAIYDKYYDSF
jgi:sugar/nucleoside kinase (ribokinase family)